MHDAHNRLLQNIITYDKIWYQKKYQPYIEIIHRQETKHYCQQCRYDNTNKYFLLFPGHDLPPYDNSPNRRVVNR